MTTDELVRTQAARQELSQRQQVVKALDALYDSRETLVHNMTWDGIKSLSKLSYEYSAQKARLAADLLQALAER